ncbi:autotransporter secretion outer membrane protein TamA [Modicisalibacter ilicicola DSM 19980]|uniref:Translocation and assembly module subunit TamA n=1 Tax=Modicisalibacter ilicicola DSM 19980 TaxID=1121942 RepID=A0A1M4XFA9_9GAMM|nr:autotransporter assembly complex family protein [Halomonas ilicicola]SHE92205.1 autotransporter secretion outer membrane protein TamA [Halomonas ilicicola DSM 19980]
MAKPRIVKLFSAFVLTSLAPASVALDADVSGVEDEVADNVVNYLAGLDAAEYGRQRLEAEIDRRIRDALKAFGYYEPQIDIRLQENGNVEQADIDIQSGPRVKITELAVEIRSDAENDDAFREMLDNMDLKEGQPLRHDRYDGLRSRLSTLALERGYFDSRFTNRRIEVRPWQESARIYLTLDSGERHVFGNISYEGSQIEESRLRNMLSFETGEPYLAGKLAEYNQRLGETGWFRSIAVRPRIQWAAGSVAQAHRNWWEAVDRQSTATDPNGAPDAGSALLAADAISAAARAGSERPPRVPVDIDLIPADRHQFEVGIGYATDVGPRTQFSWEQPWLNEDGDSLNHDLYLSGPEQEFSGEYLMPLEDPLRDRYELLYGLKNRDIEDTQSLEASIELARRWRFDNGWIQRLYFRTTYEDFTQADQKDQILLYYPGISWARTRTRNPRFPTWGDRQRITLEVSDQLWGSDATFVRTTFDTQWIRMLGDDTRFIGRAGIGAMSTDDFSNIPPSLRFFTGGDNSVRGYSYQSLAPENEEGELIGGQQLLTASIEGQRRITGDWWGAAFVDTGNAFDDWWPDDLATGAGLGVRWVSPVGPIRLDVAHPFDSDDPWRLHFAIGPEF